MMQSGVVRFTGMERVIYGKPAPEVVAGEAKRLGASRVFLMVSASLKRETPHVEEMITALGERFAGLHDRMPAHSPRDAVIEAANAARAAAADLIVTFGGGSLTDGAKVVRICLEHGLGDVAQLEPYHIQTSADGGRRVPDFDAPRVPQVSVPTTLSGGEFNALGGCTDPAKKVKEGYLHPGLVPASVIFDPAATVATPEWLWLSTGVRAIDHAVEGFCSAKASMYNDGMALHALRLLSQGLPRCKADAADLEARLMCQIGAWMSMNGVIAGVPMGASHAIGHILGGTCDVPHGVTSCIMLPQVLRYNEPVNGHRQALIAEALGRAGVAASDAVGALIAALGLPCKLSEVGVGEDKFELIAENAMHDGWLHTNPRRIETPQEVVEILRLAA